MKEKDLKRNVLEQGEKDELDAWEMGFFTPKEVAGILKVSPRTVERWIKEEKIKGIKVGGLWRIPESALKEFLRQQ